MQLVIPLLNAGGPGLCCLGIGLSKGCDIGDASNRGLLPNSSRPQDIKTGTPNKGQVNYSGRRVSTGDRRATRAMRVIEGEK
jgi:hypothetical protein